MPKFEVQTQTITNKRYEVEAKDADFARMRVQSGILAPHAILSKKVVITQIAKIGPRYEVIRDAVVTFAVHDTKRGDYVASSKFEDIAKSIARMLNDEEEAI